MHAQAADGARPPATAARASRRRNRRSDLSGRIIVAVPAIVVALVLVARGGIVFVLGAAVLGLVCMHELFALYARAHPARLAGFAALLGLMAAAQWGGTFDVLLVTVAALPIVFADTLAQRQGGAASVAISVLAIYWIGLAFAHAVLLRRLPHGEGILIDVLVGTFIGDTGAYFGGRMFGQRPLAPRISPNKTVEGLLIGMLCCVVGVWLASRYQAWLPGTHALAIGLGVAIAGPVGDLFESFIKRDAGVKDAGSLFGAHGGALDRLDALIFTVVAGYYVYIWTAHL